MQCGWTCYVVMACRLLGIMFPRDLDTRFIWPSISCVPKLFSWQIKFNGGCVVKVYLIYLIFFFFYYYLSNGQLMFSWRVGVLCIIEVGEGDQEEDKSECAVCEWVFMNWQPIFSQNQQNTVSTSSLFASLTSSSAFSQHSWDIFWPQSWQRPAQKWASFDGKCSSQPKCKKLFLFSALNKCVTKAYGTIIPTRLLCEQAHAWPELEQKQLVN